MESPVVSFIVPCYRLGHLLPECVKSILSQTYGDFEVLIMDDCSPDETPRVAASFHDSRVKHIRNEHNLGHLRNYNKGIMMSRGRYTWLISADDYLRTPYVLERYVSLMEKNEHIGYACCPGIAVKNQKETGLLQYSVYSKTDCIIEGQTFVKRLVHSNMVVAASVLVRRECYEAVSLFPLHCEWADTDVDMGWVGDWYLWCVFALHFDIAYFAEPMVCYREHDLNITATLTKRANIRQCCNSDIAIPWLIKQRANALGLASVCKECTRAAAREYSKHAASKHYRSGISCLSIGQIERSLCKSTEDVKERRWIRARCLEAKGDKHCFSGKASAGRKLYWASLRHDPVTAKVYAKLLLAAVGAIGAKIRRAIRSRRDG